MRIQVARRVAEKWADSSGEGAGVFYANDL